MTWQQIASNEARKSKFPFHKRIRLWKWGLILIAFRRGWVCWLAIKLILELTPIVLIEGRPPQPAHLSPTHLGHLWWNVAAISMNRFTSLWLCVSGFRACNISKVDEAVGMLKFAFWSKHLTLVEQTALIIHIHQIGKIEILISHSKDFLKKKSGTSGRGPWMLAIMVGVVCQQVKPQGDTQHTTILGSLTYYSICKWRLIYSVAQFVVVHELCLAIEVDGFYCMSISICSMYGDGAHSCIHIFYMLVMTLQYR